MPEDYLRSVGMGVPTGRVFNDPQNAPEVTLCQHGVDRNEDSCRACDAAEAAEDRA